MSRRDYDESDVRIRPSRRTKPRTKDRPSHDDAITAFVITVDRGRTTCVLEDGTVVTAMKARELGPKSVVVGDHVRLVGDTTGAEGSLARIVGIEERTSVLVRTVDDAAQFERNIAANIDQLVIVAAATNPEPRRGLIDRFLVSAFTEGIDPILVITKTDLAPAPDFVAEYKSIGVKCLTTKKDGDLTELHSVLNGNVSVLVGHSGVGKSTLLNQLTEADREIGHVNDVTGRGRHTSSSAYAVKLKDFPNQKVSANSWVIDTPGVRAFGLSHLDPARIIAAFDDLLEITNSCMTNCSHNEADCKLNEWMAPNGVEIPERAARVSSLRNLLAAGLE
ncbi:MAG: ribosome small subunit-dependent GTPase A [Candidatus Nanopelagicaceae bacterium]|jgi:ribosome biogenesis GTPase|nr:ribosome small subunit-dependent GTPase A [Candidatus Nanopelagicaceae bacterium]